MKGYNLLLIVIIVALVVVSARMEHSGAYFSDTQITAVTVQTGVWSTEAGSEAESLVVDKGNAHIVGSFFGPHTRLHGIKLGNAGDNPITIDKLIVNWSPAEGDVRIINYWYWGEIEWSGTAPSGCELDLTDRSIAPGENHNFDITFDTDMRDKAISIEFIMADGSRYNDPLDDTGQEVNSQEGEETSPEELPTDEATATPEPTPTTEPTPTPEPTFTPEPTPTPDLTPTPEPETTPTPSPWLMPQPNAESEGNETTEEPFFHGNITSSNAY